MSVSDIPAQLTTPAPAAYDQPVSQCAARSLKDARSTGVNTAYAARTRARRDIFQPPHRCQLAGSAGIRLHGYGTRQQPPPLGRCIGPCSGALGLRLHLGDVLLVEADALVHREQRGADERVGDAALQGEGVGLGLGLGLGLG